MKFKQNFPQIVNVFVGVMLTVSASAQTGASQKYDFNYRVSDERIAVFDDGKVTRIQLPEGMTIPIVMSQEPAGDVLLDLKKDSPYLSIQGTYSKLVMRWSGKREVVASYNGTIEVERLGRPAAFGMATPARTYGAVSEPVEFEKTQMVVKTDEKAPTLASIAKQTSETVVANASSVQTPKLSASIPLATQPTLPTAGQVTVSPVVSAVKASVNSTAIVNLSIRSGERLMPTLKKWLADQNVELVWTANAATAGRVRDVVFEDDFESSSADLSVALTESLSPFGFEAEISSGSAIRRVTVRNLRSNL